MGVVGRFCGFYGRGFWRGKKMGFVGRREKGFILEMIAGEGFCGLTCMLAVYFILESDVRLYIQWLKCYIGK